MARATHDPEHIRIANPAVLVFGEVARHDLLLPVAVAQSEGIG